MASAASGEFGTSYTVGKTGQSSGSGSSAIFSSLATWTFEMNPRGESAISDESEILASSIEAWRAIQAIQQYQIDNCDENVKIGAGKYDTTGPISMVNLMGFASPAQARVFRRTNILRFGGGLGLWYTISPLNYLFQTRNLISF